MVKFRLRFGLDCTTEWEMTGSQCEVPTKIKRQTIVCVCGGGAQSTTRLLGAAAQFQFLLLPSRTARTSAYHNKMDPVLKVTAPLLR